MSTESDRKAGRAELDRLNSTAKKPAESAEKPKKKPRYAAQSIGDVLGVGKKKQPVHAGKTVDEVVDEAVNGAKLPY